MKTFKEIFLLSVGLGLIVVSTASAEMANRITTHTQTRYRIKDELASSYSRNDLREMKARLNNRTKSFVENLRKQMNNLLPMQGNSRRVVLNAREQAAKSKDQQRIRNRLQQDRISDLRQKSQQLARNRADIKQKIRFDR